MKKIALNIIVCVLTLCSASAQTIQQNDAFWDGDHLLMANVLKSGNVVLKGRNLDNEQLSITLKKNNKVKGEYIMQKGDGTAPYGCRWGCKVRYIRQNGMYFLAFYVADNTIGQVAVLTPDNLINCSDQQAYAEESDPMSLVSIRLFDQHLLGTMLLEVQQGLADKLRAVKKRSLIEQTNLQMINNAIKTGLFVCAEDTYDDDLESQPLNPELEQIITVSNEIEFVSALGSNRTIQIKDGTTLYLSNILNDEEFFNASGRSWKDESYTAQNSPEQLVVSCSRFDGRQLDLVNIHNLTIKGGNSCSIIVAPRYACVLSFYGCSNIRLENLTMGHTEEGYCEGSVIYAEDSEAINISDCDLYGCGTYGIEGSRIHGLVMERSIIRDCSYGIMWLRGVQYATFRNCDFYRCREFDLVLLNSQCRFVRFEGCRFAQNNGSLFGNDCDITLSNCEIHHTDTKGEGSLLISYEGKKTIWTEDNAQLTKRVIGPSKF